MKTRILLAALAASAALAVSAAGDTNDVATLEQAVAASGWTVGELVAALDLMEARYNRDCQSKSGRSAWHGKTVTERVDTNTLTKVTIYEDGWTFTDKAKIVTPLDQVKAANARLKRQAVTNGVPARLAAARARQIESTVVSNVTVTVTAGGLK